MKKLQLSIVIFSFFCYSHATAGIFTIIPAFGSKHLDLKCCSQSPSAPIESNMADSIFLCPNFDPKYNLSLHTTNDGGIEDTNLDTDIDTTDSTDGSEMNDHDVSLTSPPIKKNPASIVRLVALNISNFPAEVSRLRI